MNDQTQTTSTARSTKLCVGDEVTWTHCTSNGHSMGFSARQGKITGINGGLAYVKMRNGRETYVLVTSLRRKGEKTQLTEMVEEMGASSPKAADSVSNHVSSPVSDFSQSLPGVSGEETGVEEKDLGLPRAAYAKHPVNDRIINI